jgi:hypothetical protein
MLNIIKQDVLSVSLANLAVPNNELKRVYYVGKNKIFGCGIGRIQSADFRKT